MKTSLILLSLLLTVTSSLYAWADWKAVSNQHFRIYHKEYWDEEAVRVLQTLEHYRPRMEQMTGNSLGRIPFTIEDLGNVVNGYTDVYGSRIALFAYPPTTGDLSVDEDWLRVVACHEYLHMLQIQQASGLPGTLRGLFGNIFYPNILQPSWMTEGITVYGESQLSPYSGRMNGATYPSIISVLAQKGKLPSPTKAAYYNFDAPHASFYTYGGAFYTYLAETYGEAKLAALFNTTSSSAWFYLSPILPSLSVDRSFRRVFSKNVAQLWSDWNNHERSRFYRLPGNALTDNGWFKSDLKHYDGKLWFIEGSAEKTGPNSSFFSYKLRSLELDGKVDIDFENAPPQKITLPARVSTVLEQNSDFPAGYAIKNNVLYYTRSEYARGFKNSELDGWGSEVQLWKMDLSNGKKNKIISGQIRAFCLQEDGSILISEDFAHHTNSVLHSFFEGDAAGPVIYYAPGLVSSIHPYGGKLILGMKESWRNTNIYLFDPDSRELTNLFDLPYHMSPVSVEGDVLVLNAVIDNQYQEYVYDLKNSVLVRNTDYNDVRTPVRLPEGRTGFISISEKGYDIYRTANDTRPAVLPAEERLAPPFTETGKTYSGDFEFEKQGKLSAYLSNLGHFLTPRIVHIPFAYGTSDSLAIGAMLAGKDAVGDFPLWMADLTYDTFRQKVIGSISLENHFFRPLKQVLGYSTDASRSFGSSQYVQLLRRRNYGLNNVTAGFSFNTKDDLERKVWTPFVNLSFVWPATKLSLSQYFPYETQDFWSSDRERTGWQSALQLHQKLPFSSELKAAAFVADDPDADSTEVFGKLRGCADSFETNRGGTFQVSWYKPLFRIREGIWSPQIYLEDVSLGLFYDTALPFRDSDADKMHAYGVELIAELGLAYNFMFNTGVRFSRNGDDQNRVDFLISTLF